METVTRGSTRLVYAYDTNGRTTGVTLNVAGSALYTRGYTYYGADDDATGYVQTVAYGSLGISYTYTYDGKGNITSVSDGTNITGYTYDSANQLIRENNQAAGKTWVWTYDNAGNILKREEYAYTTGTLGAVVDTVNYTYGDSDWGDLLTAYDGVAISYDENGNPLTDGTWEYTWEHGRQLASMTNGTTTWNYMYDANGMRTSRSSSDVSYTYVYNGGSLSKMTYSGLNNTTMYFSYDASGRPLSVSYTDKDGITAEYYYVTNLQGDVLAIVDSTGTAVVRYTYDAWGRQLSMTGTLRWTLGMQNPLRYRGYVYDHETGNYYLQSRYYNPTLGRFLNADAFVSTGQGNLGNNMFAYCGNNPVCNADLSGEAPSNVIFPVCLGGNGPNYSIASYSDEDKNSKELLAKILATTNPNYISPHYGRVLSIAVERDGIYESKSYFWFNLGLSGAGIAACFAAHPVGLIAGVTIGSIGIVNLIGQESVALPNKQYAQYSVTMVWESAEYQNNRIIYTKHIFKWTLIYNDTEVDNPSWYYYGQSYYSEEQP